MLNQRVIVLWSPVDSREAATHVIKWPGAYPPDEKALLGTIRAFFLAKPFVSGPVGEPKDESVVSPEVLKGYDELFHDPVELWDQAHKITSSKPGDLP